MQQRGLFLVVVMAAMAAAAVSARAQEPRTIGVFNDWTAYTYQSGSEKVCYIGSQPTAAEGNYTERGDIWTLVTHKDVVSIIIGYDFKENSDVTIKIGSNTYGLFTRDDTAWTRIEADDASLVAAMKAGSRMEVRGVSWRGTETKDTYSLFGFTKAYGAITTACAS